MAWRPAAGIVIRREVLRHRRLTRALKGVRGAWWTVTMRGPARPSSRPGAYPKDFRVRPAPGPVADDWPEPPVVDAPFGAAIAPSPPAPPLRYDLALFEQLNAEYADKPFQSTAPKYDPDSITARSRARIAGIHEQLGLAGKTVLEIGCGAGYEVWYLAHHLGCDAWGIDISPRRAWPALGGARVHLVEGDVAVRDSLPAATFDRVLSFTVWEHIRHPLEAIAELERIMKPGGLAWIRANLYRGPTSSHRTRDIAFPFPHLLFEDAVIDEAMRRKGRQPGGSVWVNRLTWEQYEAAFLNAGFTIRSLKFTTYPLDEAFYDRFEDVLGRYPKVDLERGFFQVVLEKPAAELGPGQREPRVNAPTRRRRLRAALRGSDTGRGRDEAARGRVSGDGTGAVFEIGVIHEVSTFGSLSTGSPNRSRNRDTM
jgi:SAM-dependent methyltransferase